VKEEIDRAAGKSHGGVPPTPERRRGNIADQNVTNNPPSQRGGECEDHNAKQVEATASGECALDGKNERARHIGRKENSIGLVRQYARLSVKTE
jgi:hypothetical protein